MNFGLKTVFWIEELHTFRKRKIRIEKEEEELQMGGQSGGQRGRLIRPEEPSDLIR